MGLFSKFLNEMSEAAADMKLEEKLKEAAEKVKSNETLQDLAAAVKAEADKIGKVDEDRESAPGTVTESVADTATEAAAGEVTPAGRSWGPTMPEEENQYNYSGSFIQYFEHVFSEDFPAYEVSRAQGYNAKSTVFTFRRGGMDVLIVELLSAKSDYRALRKKCRAAGLPYLRFYYDYDGWWNTRSYVTGRIREALR